MFNNLSSLSYIQFDMNTMDYKKIISYDPIIIELIIKLT